MTTKRTHYDVLDVAIDATTREIRAAYDAAVKLIDGQNVAGYLMLDEGAQGDARAEIEQAYAVLVDPARRAHYDADNGTPSKNKKRATLRFLRPVEESASPPAVEGATVRPKEAGRKPDVSEIIERVGGIGGPLLTELRQRKKLSVEDLAKKTRVNKRYIRALEAEDKEALPDRVFVRGFLTQIARVVGIDRTLLADEYVANVLEP